jgi:hypothetical protein
MGHSQSTSDVEVLGIDDVAEESEYVSDDGNWMKQWNIARSFGVLLRNLE